MTLEEVIADTERSIVAARDFRRVMADRPEDMCIKLFVGMLDSQLRHLKDELNYETPD